jgi:hypothetical protein
MSTGGERAYSAARLGTMNTIVWIGSLLGLAIGSLHAVDLYRRRVADARASATAGATAHLATAHLEGAYYGLWALALWVIFGTYVLVFWVIGAVAHSIFRLFPRRGAA